MNKNFTRPQGMSQLDYLWAHFGGYEIKDSSDNILLTEEAINNLKRLLEESETTYLYETLTSLLIVSNKIDDALTIINKGLNYNDSSDVLKSNFAEANYLLGNYNEAEEKFKALVDSNVSFMEPYYYLGLILLNKQEKDAALKVLNKATSFNDSLVSLVNCEKINNLITSI